MGVRVGVGWGWGWRWVVLGERMYEPRLVWGCMIMGLR